ncbi:helix-turn-helix transcriptional regulator [Microbulbifer sp. SAOS-129_SWC]|uniref:helix-turn-helix transcriptional regulator n=1 Tax=Microbulbifer sp. SAOS-129_SWC TaxID=3145235 RepID=UPI0032168E0E
MHTATNFRPLAPRQAEALAHRARGLSNAETAAAMACSVANVTNLLAECFFKLHARNSTDAVAKAIKFGLIQFCLLVTLLGSISPDALTPARSRIPRRPAKEIRIRPNREYQV